MLFDPETMSYRQGREGGTRFTFIRKWGEWEGVKFANFDMVSLWTLLKLTAKRKVERRQFSTSSSFVKI